MATCSSRRWVVALAVTSALAVAWWAVVPAAGGATTLGRRKVRGERAWTLAVDLKFQDAAAAATLVRAWREAADYCLEHEPFLYHYEVSKSDKDPLRYLVYERYRSKADYLGAHRQSVAFNAFRPIMKAMQDEGRVVVTGESWDELGEGFV
jgi:quinol monooxygenase YgiN